MGLPSENRWRILAVVILGPFMGTLDASIVNVALPVIAQRLGSDLGRIQWVVTSYLIVISSLILIFGKLSDKIGKSRVFACGFFVFGVGSLFCALSTTLVFLVIARVVQAAGAAMFMSSNQGIVADVFPPGERGRALGLVGSAVAVGTMSGPPLGGFLAHFFEWQSIFIINIPIAMFSFAAALLVLPKDARGDHSAGPESKMDIAGGILLVLAVSLVFWTLLSLHEQSINRVILALSALAGALFLSLLVFTEMSVSSPLIAVELFRIPLFAVSLLSSFISFLILFALTIIHPFYLQNVMHLSPAQTGLMMLAFPITALIAAPLSGYVSDKIGAGVVTVAGLAVLLCGVLLFTLFNAESSLGYIFIAALVAGTGQGIFQSPNTSILMSLAPRDKLGITGSINAFARNMGMVSGIAFGVTLLYFCMGPAAAAEGKQHFFSGEIFVRAMRTVYWCASFMCMVAIALTIGRAGKTAQINDIP